MNKILLLTLLFAALLSMSSAARLWCKSCKQYEDDRCTTGETKCHGPSRGTTCMRVTYSNGTGSTSCAYKWMCEDIRDRNKNPNKSVLCCETNLCNEMQPWTSSTSTPSDSSPTEGP